MDLVSAASAIFEARNKRVTIPRLPESLRPRNQEDAMAIQQAVSLLLAKPTVAWKCALPKPDRIPCAPIFDIYPAGDVPVNHGGNVKLVEPEIAFVLSRDIPPRDEPYTDSEILESISSARLAIEIIGSRFDDIMATDFHEKTADHIMNESLVVGPEIAIQIARDLAGFDLLVTSNQRTLLTTKAQHPDGGPYGGLVWLANYLRQTGEGLRKGAVVTTGSYAGFVELPFEQQVSLTFGSLGAVDLRLVRV